jgi:hypothetical protein
MPYHVISLPRSYYRGDVVLYSGSRLACRIWAFFNRHPSCIVPAHALLGPARRERH